MNHAEEESPMEQTGEYIVVNGPEDLKGLDLDDGTYDEMDEDAMDAGSLSEPAVPLRGNSSCLSVVDDAQS